MTKIVLWGTKASPFVRKVILALYEKELSFEQLEVLPSSFLKVIKKDPNAKFSAISPLGKIPAIEIDNFHLADSAVIIQYLEHKFAQTTKLYPTQVENYAKALWLERFSDDELAKVATRRLFYEIYGKPLAFGSKPDEKLVKIAKEKQLPPLLKYLDTCIQNNTYFVENEFSIADIAITTQLLALEMANIAVDDMLYPNLHKYFNNIKNRPSVQKIII